MKKTFKNQLPVFIPECILLVTGVTFAVLLMLNFPYMYSYISKEPAFGVKGSLIDLILFVASSCLICASSIALICMGHLFKGKDPVKWVDKAAFVSGVILLAYDLALVIVMVGLLGRGGYLVF